MVVYVNDADNDTINEGYHFTCGDTNCSNPIAKGISQIGGKDAGIETNAIKMPYHSIASNYSSTDFTGIYVENSAACYMTCNQTFYLDTAIVCSGTGDMSFNVFGNIMTGGTEYA